MFPAQLQQRKYTLSIPKNYKLEDLSILNKLYWDNTRIFQAKDNSDCLCPFKSHLSIGVDKKPEF